VEEEEEEEEDGEEVDVVVALRRVLLGALEVIEVATTGVGIRALVENKDPS
jgi:hypothetical protein